MTTTRLASFFNEAVQWDIIYVYDDMLSHCLDEAIRLTRVKILPSRSAPDIVNTITRQWLQHYGPMRYLISDGESGLSSDVAATWADRHCIQLRQKPSGAHAQMVERHHDIFRQLAHRTDAQLKTEGIVIEKEDLYAEVEFVKNCLVSVGGTAPLQALLGRLPPLLSEFEPASETQLEDITLEPCLSTHD